MKDEYIIDTKNGAKTYLTDSYDGCVQINTGPPLSHNYDHRDLRILARELAIAADKLEVGTLFDDEFDWDNAKPGMCFEERDGAQYWYVAEDFDSTGWVVVSRMGDCSEFENLTKDSLTRHPEGDADCVKGAV